MGWPIHRETVLKLKHQRRNVIELYSLPTEVQFCDKCTMSNQRPRITFNREGVCSACVFAEEKRNFDWIEREEELRQLLDRHRGRGEFDVIVPCSGGKDGGYVAHQLQEVYNMKVLAVTWAPLKPTGIGLRNLESFKNAGFYHVLGQPNPVVTRKLTRDSFVRIGDPFQPFIYGQYNFPLSVAKQYGVTLVMYGENGEVEYGGDSTGAKSPLKKVENEEPHYFSGWPIESWEQLGYEEADLSLFRRPRELGGIEQHFFGYYKFWDPQENFYYAAEHLGFEPAEERSEGTYSRYASLDDRFDGFHYYLGFIKFGIGRATSDTAHEIRDGKISREEGIELVRQFDGEFPNRHFEEFLAYVDMDQSEFWDIIDSWRSPHIWSNSPDGSWILRQRI